MLQGEVGGELVEQALLSHFEDHPDQPLQVDERWGNDALCTQKFQCLFDQWDRAVAFHRIQVFIDGMLSFPILCKFWNSVGENRIITWALSSLSHTDTTLSGRCQVLNKSLEWNDSDQQISGEREPLFRWWPVFLVSLQRVPSPAQQRARHWCARE